VVRAKHTTDGLGEPSEPLDGSTEHTATSASARAHDGSRSRRIRLITLALCLGVAAVGVSVAVFASTGGQAGQVAGTGNGQASQAPAPQAPVASAPSPGNTGLAYSGGGTSATGGRLPRREHKLLKWKAGPGGTALSAVENQMGTAMQDAGLKSYAEMRAACVSLASDVSSARNAPPIPEEATQRLYARALTGLAGAAAECRAAISLGIGGGESVEIHVNRVRLNLARVKFAAMSKKLYLVTRQILSVRLRSLSLTDSRTVQPRYTTASVDYLATRLISAINLWWMAGTSFMAARKADAGPLPVAAAFTCMSRTLQYPNGSAQAGSG
jgi:hypothetical protein